MRESSHFKNSPGQFAVLILASVTIQPTASPLATQRVPSAAQEAAADVTKPQPVTSPSFTLSLFDYAVHLSAEVRRAVDLETDSILGEAGVRVVQVWDAAAPRSTRGYEIRVVLTTREPTDFGQRFDVMAMAYKSQPFVYVFYLNVLGTLGDDPTNPRRRTPEEIGRAIARVIVHEVIHVLVPEGSHAVAGLMDRNQGKSFLLQPRVFVLAKTAEAIRRALDALSS